MIEQSSDGIVLFDRFGIIINGTWRRRTSPALNGQKPWENPFGRSSFSLPRMPFDDLTKERNIAWLGEAGSAWQSHQYPLTFRRADGAYLVLETNIYAIQLEEGIMIGCISRDITEKKQAEEKILDLARFPSQNPSPVVRIGLDGTVIYTNAASGPLLGYWGCQVGGILPPIVGESGPPGAREQGKSRDRNRYGRSGIFLASGASRNLAILTFMVRT